MVDPDASHQEQPESATLGDLLYRTADSAPAQLALVQGDSRLSFGELADSALAFARALVSLGVDKGDIVTAQLPNWWETQVIAYGALLVGAIFNPVVSIYRDHVVGFIVKQARPKVIIVPGVYRGHDHLGMAVRIVADLGLSTALVAVRVEQTDLPDSVHDFATLLAHSTQAAPGVEIPFETAPDDIALLFYTSGSTADPKGALHSHRALLHEVRQVAHACRLGQDDTVFMASPMAHITGFIFGLVLPVDLRITCVVQDRWDPEVAVTLIEKQGCTFTVSATPFLLGMVKAYEARAHRSCMRVFICGGAEIGPELMRRARRVMGTRVVRTYGSTEFPTFCLGDPFGDAEISAETDGFPVPLAEYRLDRSGGRGTNDGGELLIKGAELFLGYLDKSLNDAAFTKDRFFRTGDLVRFNEHGACIAIGRQKDIVIRGGENLSAIEIEDHLQQHPSVGDVAIVAMPDEHLGEKICAYIVPAPGEQAPDRQGLKAFLLERGLEIQKSPERVELISELPRTASGKVQKFRLREMIAQQIAAETT